MRMMTLLLLLAWSATDTLAQLPAQLSGHSWFPKAPPLPASQGEILRVTNVAQLFAAAATVKPGETILVADGHYWMPRSLQLRTDGISLRGESGFRERVILEGARSQHSEMLALFSGSGVSIANLTIQNVTHNGIKINSDSNVQRVSIYNCVLHNIWQRGVKGVKVPPAERETNYPRNSVENYFPKHV